MKGLLRFTLGGTLFLLFISAKLLLLFSLKRLGHFMKKKGIIYFAILLVLMNLDLMLPMFGGKLALIFLIFGPAAGLALLLLYRFARDIGPHEFFFYANSLMFIGAYGLLKAWSGAAGAEVPFFLALAGKAILGTVGNVLVGSATAVIGLDHYAPFPVVNPGGLWIQVTQLNVPLTLISFITFFGGVRLWIWASSKFGMWSQKLSGHEKEQVKNKFLSPSKVSARALGFWGNLTLRLFNLIQRPRIPYQHIVVGMSPARRIWSLAFPLAAIGHLMLAARLRPEGTIFDPRPLIVVPSMGTLVIAGRRAGKTQTQIANEIMNDWPMLMIETQGNAFSKEVPINAANGRTTVLIAPELGLDSPSIDYLAGLDPQSTTFSGDIAIRAAGLIDRHQQIYANDRILVNVTLDLIETAMANVVTLASEQGVKPTLLDVYDVVTDSEGLYDKLANWAEYGHLSFRRVCRALMLRLHDPEYVNGMEAIWGPELRFLDDPVLSCLVSGGTKRVFDPRRLLTDRSIDVVIQIEERLVEGYGALLRLLMLGIVGPRMALNEAEARATPARGLHIWIDELAALKGARICDQIVVFGGQKGFSYTYCMQSMEQVDEHWSDGTFEKWSNSSDVIICGKSNSASMTEYMEKLFGQTAIRKDNKAIQGNFAAISPELKSMSLVSREALDAQQSLYFTVWARPRKGPTLKFQCNAPVHFVHPALGTFLDRAKKECPAPERGRRR